MHSDRPSATAMFIARSLLFAARDPALAWLVDAPARATAAACLAAAGIDARRWWRWCGVPMARRTVWAWERLVLPGIVLHFVLRKRAIADAASAAIAAGASQVVVLAAGFDPLGWRIVRGHPLVAVAEIDHPATQAVKRKAMTGAARSLRFHAADLGSTSVADILTAAGIDRARPTVVIAEGLLMYFPPQRIAALFAELATALVPGSRLVFTFMAEGRGGRLGFPAGNALIDAWLRWHGEPFRWGLPRRELPAFLDRYGFALLDHADRDTLARRFLPPGSRRRGAAGEEIVVAVRLLDPVG